MSTVEMLEGTISQFLRRWLGLPRSPSSIALYGNSTMLQLPISGLSEEFKSEQSAVLGLIRHCCMPPMQQERHPGAYPQLLPEDMKKSGKLDDDRKQLQINYTHLAEESDELLTNYTDLLEERDQLHTNVTDITEDRDLCLDRYRSLAADKAQLLASYNNVAREKNNLMTSYNNLAQQKKQLATSNNDLAQQKKQLTTSNNNLEAQRNRFYSKLQSGGWIRFQSNFYFFSTESKNWHDSRADCRQRAADLVIVNSWVEEDFLSSHLQESTWMGLSDIDTEGVWKWVDGTQLTSGFWAPGEPNNVKGDEDCVHLDKGREWKWNDNTCSQPKRWTCELTF
ncbi:asialoglycoprotein receptor 1-like [Engraulis encrasicolus]|uniref:asialoglycoprotein receptor 1-like n=1 Tax=Engraulis encrasicolus TaxID=184585 RepID=UPI002FD1B72C